MTDKREQILQRIAAVAAGVSGVTAVFRNTESIGETRLPAIVILDGDEVADDRDMGRGRPGISPNIMVMRPELRVIVASATRDPGTVLNELRAAFVKAILEDATLISICGSNGGMRYEGCGSGFAAGRTLQGEMAVNIAFTYVFRASDL
jgi:hypothetical protein